MKRKQIKINDISKNPGEPMVNLDTADLMPLPDETLNESKPSFKPLTESQKNNYECSLDGVSALTPSYVTFTSANWIDVYQMANFEKGLFFASGGGGYGPSAVIHIHYNYSTAPVKGYLNVISTGGDTSGYTLSFRLTDGGMVQAQCNLGNSTQMSFTKIGGFDSN